MRKSKETMGEFAERRGNEMEKKVAKKEAGMAPKNTTGMGKKGMKMKNSSDSKGPGPDSWTKGMKKPKGGGK